MVESVRQYEGNGEAYYYILYHAYLSPQTPKDVNEIIERVGKDVPGFLSGDYYRYRNKAITSLGDILWGFETKEALELEGSLFSQNMENIAS